MKETKRFDVVYKQGLTESYKVIIDKETGVNYLYVTDGPTGGLTVLLDSTGKPIITRDK